MYYYIGNFVFYFKVFFGGGGQALLIENETSTIFINYPLVEKSHEVLVMKAHILYHGKFHLNNIALKDIIYMKHSYTIQHIHLNLCKQFINKKHYVRFWDIHCTADYSIRMGLLTLSLRFLTDFILPNSYFYYEFVSITIVAL